MPEQISVGSVFKSLYSKRTRLLHLWCPSICVSSYSNDFSTTGQLQLTPGRWPHLHQFERKQQREAQTSAPWTREKAGRDQWWWEPVRAMWGWLCSTHAQLRKPSSLTAPAQLLVSMRTQPLSVLVLKDTGAPSAPYRTHGGACTLCAATEAALTTWVLTLLLNMPPSGWQRMAL